MRARRILAVAVAAAAAVALLPSSAAAADALVRIGRVQVLQQGRPSAADVLILMPGTQAGAGSTAPVGADIVKRAPRWQVWNVDRRENALEDGSVLDRALRRRTSVQDLFAYYLGWLTDPSVQPHFAPPGRRETNAARGWGLRTAISDLRRVVLAARARGGRVVLGGHSLGASIAVAYATWDFGGRAGARDLDGLVLVDGGAAGRPLSAQEARDGLARLRTGSPFTDLSGTGVPWALGAFGAVGGAAARLEPDARSIFTDFALLPAELRPPFALTNEAALGYATDTETASPRLALIQLHAGGLAAAGDPRPWRDGELVPIQRLARLFARTRVDGLAWFHPARLSLDAAAINNGRAAPAQKVLGLRTTRAGQLRIPLYAFQTALGQGRVLRGARQLARIGGAPSATLVDRSATTAHLDPLAATPSRNAFLETVVPFLRRVG